MQKINHMKESLKLFGLSDAEADQFVQLVEKLKIPESEQNAIDSELEEAMPFEGGASTGECLILLARAHEDERK